MRPDVRRAFQWTGMLTLGVVALVIAVILAGPDRLASSLRDARPLPLALAGVFGIATLLARGGLWSVLLVAGHRRRLALTAAAASAVGWLAGHVLPLRAGVIVRAGLVARRARIPLPTVLSSLALERGLDFFVTALVAIVTTIFVGWRLGATFLPFIFLSAAVLTIFGLLGIVIARSPGMLLRLVPARFRPKAEDALVAFRTGFTDVASDRRRLARALGWMALVALFQVAFLVALVMAFAPSLGWSATLLGVPWLALSFYLAFTPSNLGTFEGAFAAIYVPLGMPLETALATAVLMHAAMIVFALVIGGGAWVLFSSGSLSQKEVAP